MDRIKIGKDFDKQIKQMREEAEGNLMQLTKEKEVVLQKLGVIAKYEKKKPKDEKEFRELSSILCFSSVAFCCSTPNNKSGAGKGCPWRDKFLSVLGISEERFLEFKEVLDSAVMVDCGI